MSNENNPAIPPQLQKLVDDMREAGHNVIIKRIDEEPEAVETPFERNIKVVNKLMAEAKFSKHRACLVRNSMLMTVEVLALTELADHLVESHLSVEAMDWVIATFTLVGSLYPAIRQAEIDTNEGFSFTAKTDDYAQEIASQVAELRRVRDLLAASRDSGVH